MTKLMVSIREENFRLLNLEAMERGISIQELLRAVIVPEWMRASKSLTLEQGTGQGQQPQGLLREERKLATLLTQSARRTV